MQYSEIYKKVSEGGTVHWSSQGYTVILKDGELYIVYDLGGRMEIILPKRIWEDLRFTAKNIISFVEGSIMFNVTFVYNDKNDPENNIVWEDDYDYMTDVICVLNEVKNIPTIESWIIELETIIVLVQKIFNYDDKDKSLYVKIERVD
jgi:hypothetical protein